MYKTNTKKTAISFRQRKTLKPNSFIDQIQNLMYLLYLISSVDKWKNGFMITNQTI